MYLSPWRFASAAEKTTASKDLSSIRRREEEKRALFDGGISRMIIKGLTFCPRCRRHQSWQGETCRSKFKLRTDGIDRM